MAQFLYIKAKNLLKGPTTTCNRHFTDNNVEEFKYLLHAETWDDVLASNQPNTSFNLFMNTFINYFNTAFSLKVTYVKGTIANKWITKGLIISRNKLQLLNNIIKTTNLSMESVKHIQNQLIFRNVVK